MACITENTGLCSEDCRREAIEIENYIKCVIDTVKDDFNGEIDSEMLYMKALKHIFGSTSGIGSAIICDSLMMEALKGIFTAIDKHSTFHSHMVSKIVKNKLCGDSDSLGFTAARVSESIFVHSVYPFSPAYNAGICIKDEIVAVNGESTANCTLEDAYKLICKDKSEKTILDIINAQRGGIVRKEIQNEKIKTNSVSLEIKDSIGYVRIHSFNKNTYEFVCSALDKLDQAKVSKVILDLRYNGGGDLKQAVLTAGRFVPKGPIAKLKFRSPCSNDAEYFSELEKTKYSLAVLINQETASSSEIIAGAIQDTKAGVVIGTNSVGKASVQKMFPLLTCKAYIKAREIAGIDIINAEELKARYSIQASDDEIIGMAVITIGEYFTAGGRTLGNAGITPDIYVEAPEYVKKLLIHKTQPLKKLFEYKAGDECREIYNAKVILECAGYSVEKADGIMDGAASAAIAKFQNDKNLKISGTLDFPTQAALNSLLESFIFKEDTQISKAVEILQNQ